MLVLLLFDCIVRTYRFVFPSSPTAVRPRPNLHPLLTTCQTRPPRTHAAARPLARLPPTARKRKVALPRATEKARETARETAREAYAPRTTAVARIWGTTVRTPAHDAAHDSRDVRGAHGLCPGSAPRALPMCLVLGRRVWRTPTGPNFVNARSTQRGAAREAVYRWQIHR